MKIRIFSLGFGILFGSNLLLSAADVNFVRLSKGGLFRQDDAGAPTPEDSYSLQAEVSASNVTSVDSSSLILPSTEELFLDFDFEEVGFGYQTRPHVDRDDLDSDFPAGNYHMMIATAHNGTKNITLRLANSPYPPAPHVSNYDAAQLINPGANFTLRWDAFAGGTANDFISVKIQNADTGDTIVSTPDIWQAGTLNGTATSLLILAGKFSEPGNYTATITFYKVLTRDRTTYAGVLAASALQSRTEVSIAVVAVAPQITKGPQSKVVNIGETVTFSVTATGTDLNYFWTLNDNFLNEGGNVYYNADQSSVTISNVQPSDAGTYGVTVHNDVEPDAVSEATLTVNCKFTVEPSSALFSSAGGAGVVSIVTSDDCPWTVENTNAWIQITDSGTGGGDVDYTVDELPLGLARFGYVKVAGKPVLITQVHSFAPASLDGKSLANTITGGNGGFVSSGSFLVAALPTNTFRTTFSYTTNVDTGTYSYERINATNAILTVTSSNTITATLYFTSPSGGTFSADDGAGGTQEGTFVVTDTRADMNLDGRGDLLFQHPNGTVSTWYMNGTNLVAGAVVRSAGVWRGVATADFNGDGKGDILFQHASGQMAVWFMNKLGVAGSWLVKQGTAPVGWKVASVADFDGNGSPDILFQHASGALAVWLFNGTNYLSPLTLKTATGASPPASWRVVGTADLNGDGEPDVVLQNTVDTRLAVWYFVGGKFFGSALVNGNGAPPGVAWKLLSIKDFNDDGHPDFVFQNEVNGKIVVWFMNNVTITRSVVLKNSAAGGWKLFGPK